MWHLTAWSFFFSCGFTGLKLEDWYEQHLYDVWQSFVPNIMVEHAVEQLPAFCVQSMFFFLVQTEQGDIFKVTLETDEDIVSLTFDLLQITVVTLVYLIYFVIMSFSRSEVLWHCGISGDRCIWSTLTMWCLKWQIGLKYFDTVVFHVTE